MLHINNFGMPWDRLYHSSLRIWYCRI